MNTLAYLPKALDHRAILLEILVLLEMREMLEMFEMLETAPMRMLEIDQPHA